MELIIKYSKEIALFALILNFAGVIMITFALRGDFVGSDSREDKGKKHYLTALIYPRLFRWGMASLAFGCLLQIITHVHNA